MQPNYCYQNVYGDASAPFWNTPNPDIVLRDQIVPPIYAPYGTRPFWPVGTTPPPPTDNVFTTDPTTDRILSLVQARATSGYRYGPSALGATPPAVTSSNNALIPSDTTMPVITTPPVTAAGAPDCGLGGWASAHPLLAVAGAFLLYHVLRGHRK